MGCLNAIRAGERNLVGRLAHVASLVALGIDVCPL